MFRGGEFACPCLIRGLAKPFMKHSARTGAPPPGGVQDFERPDLGAMLAAEWCKRPQFIFAGCLTGDGSANMTLY